MDDCICVAAYVTLEEAKELILQIMKKMKRKCKKYPEMSLDTIRTALTVCAMNIGYLQLRRENYVEAVNICQYIFDFRRLLFLFTIIFRLNNTIFHFFFMRHIVEEANYLVEENFGKEQ